MGTQSRNVECFNPKLNSFVTSNYCDKNLLLNTTQTCKKVCKDEWKIVLKGKCSVTCGRGWRFRYIECHNSDGKQSNSCQNNEKPSYYEECDGIDCFKWETTSWSKCSSECGEGTKTRRVVCRSNDGIVVTDEKICKSIEKPEESVKCVENLVCNKWITGNWSEVIIDSSKIYI